MPKYKVTHFFILKHKTKPYEVEADTEDQAVTKATALLNSDKSFNALFASPADDAHPDWDDWDCDPEVEEIK